PAHAVGLEVDRFRRRKALDDGAELRRPPRNPSGRAKASRNGHVARLAQGAGDGVEVIDLHPRPDAEPVEAEQAVNQDDRRSQSRQGRHAWDTSSRTLHAFYRTKRGGVTQPEERDRQGRWSYDQPHYHRHKRHPRSSHEREESGTGQDENRL